jgi:hypothetical protein
VKVFLLSIFVAWIVFEVAHLIKRLRDEECKEAKFWELERKAEQEELDSYTDNVQC